MPNIKIRPAIASDISVLIAIDHNYTSDRVWKMAIHAGKAKQTVTVQFQDVALPRTVRVEYPRSPRALSQDWTQRSGLLVAEYQNTAIGYISLNLNMHERITWVADFAVKKNLRRQGVGSALAISALDWCTDHSSRYLIFAFQPKNYPAIKLAKKLGFGFSGFQDHYFRNLDTALFFTKSVQ
jgi:GNAT superfamily N-acetyltransferase